MRDQIRPQNRIAQSQVHRQGDLSQKSRADELATIHDPAKLLNDDDGADCVINCDEPVKMRSYAAVDGALERSCGFLLLLKEECAFCYFLNVQRRQQFAQATSYSQDTCDVHGDRSAGTGGTTRSETSERRLVFSWIDTSCEVGSV